MKGICLRDGSFLAKNTRTLSFFSLHGFADLDHQCDQLGRERDSGYTQEDKEQNSRIERIVCDKLEHDQYGHEKNEAQK